MLAHIKNMLDSLSQAERQVGQWLLADPSAAADATLQQWAQHAKVSEPTVVRFCKSVANDSFANFKRKLTADIARTQVFLHHSVRPDDGGDDLTRKLFDSAIASLMSVRDNLPAESVEWAITLLEKAERVEIYGLGGSGLVASDAEQKLFRLGKPVAAWSDPHVHRVSAALLDERAAVLAISASGETADLNNSISAAKKAGAKIIAISRSGSELSRMAHAALPVNVEEDSDLYAPIKARLAQLAVIDVLAIGLACRDPETQNRRLQLAQSALTTLREKKEKHRN
ncbi:MAG: MurR/RpiR family transcriptional regulator [Granulosicoccaceae bacterium]